MTTIHVSKNDPSAFSTLQEAILSIDDRHDETIRIEVAPGIYEEKLFIRKENIEIVGDDPLMTVFRYGDGAKSPVRMVPQTRRGTLHRPPVHPCPG